MLVLKTPQNPTSSSRYLCEVKDKIRARVNQGEIGMGKVKNQSGKDVIFTLEGKPVSIPIVITDSFRFTKRSIYEDEPKKKSLTSKVIGFLNKW